jgi:chromosome segregation ATPase
MTTDEGMTDIDGIVDASPAETSAGAPPPPPPPPPAGWRPGTGNYARPATVVDVIARVERLAAGLLNLEREATELHSVAKKIEPEAPSPSGVPAAELADARRALEVARADLKRSTDEQERLEGELQSLKVFREQTRTKIRTAVAEIVDLKLEPEAEETVRGIVIDRDRLQEDKAKVETELNRIKTEAAKRLTALKAELDKVTQEHETVRLQKDNLMRQLRSRDEESQKAGGKQVTLEDITSSEIFRNMLGNLRKTTRQEVTILHESIASIRAIDPKAYETVLEIVARAFAKAKIENPLATLPRD